jgi:hypothetical protein
MRPLIDNCDRVIPAPVSCCQLCQAALQGVAPTHILRRQITKLLVSKPFIIETQQHEAVCPHCQTPNLGVLPAPSDTVDVHETCFVR